MRDATLAGLVAAVSATTAEVSGLREHAEDVIDEMHPDEVRALAAAQVLLLAAVLHHQGAEHLLERVGVMAAAISSGLVAA